MTWKFLTECVRLYVPIDENDFMIFCRLEAVARAGAAKMGRPEAGAANKNKKFCSSILPEPLRQWEALDGACEG